MSVYQKVYVSTSVKQMSANEIDILVSNATKNNIQNGITGMLLFTGTSYLQLLEGDASKVRHTYKKIQEDPRHTSFLTICERKIKKRSYPQSFSFRTTDEATLQAVYTLFLEDPDLAIKKMNLMTEVKLSKFVGFDPERLLFYSNAEPYSTTTSESFYKFSTQVAADEVFLMRDTSEIVYVNYSACKKLEYSASELIGKKVWEWDPLFPKEVWPGFWSDFINKKHLHFQTQHKKKSGEVFPVEIHAHLYEENDKQYLLAFVNDISQKMQAQKELTEHKKNLENIIHLRTEKLTQIYEELMLHKQMLDKYISVLILDDELNVKYENEYFLNIVSKLQVDLEDIHKSIQEQIKKKVQIQDKFSNACLWKGEITLSNKSDIKILFEVSLYLFEKEGKEGFYLVAYDITEKIEYQEVLRYYANHDPLSGLKNFNEFSNVFGKLQRLCMRQGDGSKFALM